MHNRTAGGADYRTQNGHHNSYVSPTTPTLVVWPSAKAQQNPSIFIDATQQPFTITGDVLSVQPAVESVLVEWVGDSG